MAKKVQNKKSSYIAEESPFSAEQNSEVRFCVGYFVYKIRSIKRMHVQKPL